MKTINAVLLSVATAALSGATVYLLQDADRDAWVRENQGLKGVKFRQDVELDYAQGDLNYAKEWFRTGCKGGLSSYDCKMAAYTLGDRDKVPFYEDMFVPVPEDTPTISRSLAQRLLKALSPRA